MFKSVWVFLSQWVWIFGVDKHQLEDKFTTNYGVDYGLGAPVKHHTPLVRKVQRNTKLQMAYDKALGRDVRGWRRA